MDDNFDLFDLEEEENEIKPIVGEYWTIKNGNHFLYAIITNDSPLEVNYFTPSVKGNFYSLNETIFAVCSEDLKEKLEPPKIVPKGKRKFYLFSKH